MSNSTTISKYLISKIKENNVKHVFGIPGDYIINFYKDLAEEKDIKTVVTCDEQGAGFAADAYARLNGLGVAVFTYCAGALKAVNTTAQAFADRSPVVVIAGAPTRKSVKNNELVHHRVKDFNTELKVFEQVTVASAYLREDNAFQEIERVFETVKALSGPGYIEVPYDLVDYPLPIPTSTKFQYPYRAMEDIEAEKMHEAMAEVTNLLQHATNPVVIVGLEVHRLGIQKEVQRFIERLDLPFVTMIQSKGVISEDHPNYLGVYEGAMCRTELREFVERADCLIMLGIFKTDMDLGYFSAKLDPKRTIHARKDCLCVSYHNYQDIGIKMVLHEIDRRNIVLGKGIERDSWTKPIDFKSSAPSKGKKLTTGKFFEFINATLNSNTVTIADIGASLFGGGEMRLPKDAMFVGSPYYACMGFAVPGGLGTACAKPDMRTVVIVGDGAFQMTGTEVSTMIRNKLNPIVIILNNDGYTTERIIEEGPFDDIQPWNYAKITELFGGGKSFVAKTEDEFMDALKHSYANKDTVSVIEAKVDRLDLPAAQVRELDYNKGRR